LCEKSQKSIAFIKIYLYNIFEQEKLLSHTIILFYMKRGVFKMRLRKQPLGDKNLVGSRVESARKNQGMKQKELLAQLQVRGVDMNSSGLSKLEGQIRLVSDYELLAISQILGVSVMWLLTGEDE
jgi:hypothetical protein